MGHRPYMYRIRDRGHLVKLMHDNEISCRQLAALAGCSPSTAATLWNGKIDRVNEFVARGICRALEADLTEMFEETGRVSWQRADGGTKSTAGTTPPTTT